MRAPSPTKLFCRKESNHGSHCNPDSQNQPYRPARPRVSRQQDHALRRMRPQRHLRAHHRRHVRDGRPARARHEALRHRLLLQEPSLLHVPLAQLQQRARPHALRRHRRPAGQQNHDGHRRLRRRRHRLHRHRPVRPPHAPQSADDLHHRGQRRVRPHQRPVLRHCRHRLKAQDRRHQRSPRHRHLLAGHPARRHLRRPLLLRRQKAAAHHAQGGHRPPGHGHARRHLALRHLQRS